MAEGRKTWPPVKDGWFVEPGFATRFLLRAEAFEGGIWDPAAGQGNIIEACLAAGRPALGTDLVRRTSAAWFAGEYDFIADTPRAWDAVTWMPNVICNPPYGRALLAEAFIRRACSLPAIVKVAMFLNSKFMYGGKRARGIYQDLPPDRVYPISPRPSCPPGEFLLAGGKAEGGVENFAWFVWCMSKRTGRTEMIWEPQDGKAGT